MRLINEVQEIGRGYLKNSHYRLTDKWHDVVSADFEIIDFEYDEESAGMDLDL